MSIYEAAARLTVFVLCFTGLLAAAWLLLEHIWERAWDALDRLRDRIRSARRTTEYQTVARRHGRTVRT